MKKLPWLTLTIAIACIAIHLLQLDSSLQWTRGDGFSLTRCWTLASSHLTHWSTSHLFWNVLMFTTLGWLIEMRSRQAMMRALILSTLFIVPAVALFMPEVGSYRGLSGIASAFYVLLACMIWKQQGGILMKVIAGLAIASLLGKCVYELAFETSAFAQMAETIGVSPQAHLAGALAGLLALISSRDRPAVRQRIIIPASQGACA